MRIVSIALWLLIVSYLGPGCKSSKKTTQDAELQAGSLAAIQAIPVLAPLPQGLKIICGQGGGFTGTWQGFTMTGDGQVQAWEGQQAEANAQPAGEIPQDSLQVLWNQLDAMNFMNLELTDYANLTAIIEVQTEDGSNRVSWLPKIAGLEPLETPIDSFYVRCTNMAAALVH